MSTNEIVSLVKDVGVPVAMLLWFALRVERRLDAIAAQLVEVAKAMTRTAAALEQVDDALDVTPKPVPAPKVGQ